MFLAVIQAGNISEMLTAGMLKAFFDLFVNFFQRLDTIGRKGRGADCNIFLALFGHTRHFFDC